MRPNVCAAAAFFAVLSVAGAARADPYVLRADAYAAAADDSIGLLVLQGDLRDRWLDTEAMVWTGNLDTPADVLVLSARVRDPKGRGDVRAGRFLVATGAIRPLHIDGAMLTVRAPSGTTLETFGGIPVERGLVPRDYDWVTGGRLSQHFGDVATAGVSFVHQRDDGGIAFEELGVDATLTPARWFDASFTSSFDMMTEAFSEVRASMGARAPIGRLDLFAVRRTPSSLLPATSLFAALGDIPSDRVGADALWRAAPRLDVLLTGSVESLGGSLGGEQRLRATLRLDDDGEGALGLEGRRQAAPDASWTGVRATARVPITTRFTAAAELEIAVPDVPDGRGSVWPWGLVALTFRPVPAWDVAAAIEAGATPESASFVTGLARLTRRWQGP